MRVLTTEIEGVVIIEPRVFADERGFFYESFQSQRYHGHGMPLQFVQDNFSHSVKHTIRGLHYQLNHPQGKLVMVQYGSVLDVIVDIRMSSPTFGKAISIELDDKMPKQIYMPPGVAHGFCMLSDVVGFSYKCTDYYSPEDERGIIWDDPDLMIPWPTSAPILSPKDKEYLRLKDINKDELFL